MYKSLSFSNAKFFNQCGRDTHRNYFTRSENTNEFGLTILYGVRLISLEKLLDIEVFCGMGYRKRIRNYTTTESTGAGCDNQPLGSFNLNQDYPMVVVGFKIGINTFFK